jgi:NADPH-dependent curcumin reductase CurA
LAALLPDYADSYFDNVGGETLDVMLALVKRHGIVAVCGGISAYNATDPLKLINWGEVIYNRLTLQGESTFYDATRLLTPANSPLAGFIFSDKAEVFPKATEDLSNWIKEGKIDISEGETVIEAKIEDVPQVWHKLFEGGNRGKLITKLIHA